MYKNMKISITDAAHLKAVCDVLESMGYEKDWLYWDDIKDTRIVTCHSDGTLMDLGETFIGDDRLKKYKTVTLADLLRMRDDSIKAKSSSL